MPDITDHERKYDMKDCNGTGNQPESQVCPECGGSGSFGTEFEADGGRRGTWQEPCSECNGTGQKNPDPPEESQDERIKDLFISHVGTLHEGMMMNIRGDSIRGFYDPDVESKFQYFKSGFKSRDEEVKEILSALDTTIEERDEYAKEIEDMKEKFWECIHDAETIYGKWFALERHTSSKPIAKENYFKRVKSYLRQLEKKK